MKNKRIWPLFLLLLSSLSLFAQYKMALPGYRYAFPHDNFNHPDYATEWWYYTGNLRASDGHRFGFELTFFRQALDRSTTIRSTWAVQDLYLAHLALSDLDSGKFYYTERINRAGPGLAGVSEQQGKIWNGNWRVDWKGSQLKIFAIDNNFTINLELNEEKPAVIHGENGVSQKSAGAGHASHYISYTRLRTDGALQLNGRDYIVEGSSWMDHEFFSEPLSENQAGWDWISLQLENNTEIMLYRLRRKDGTVDPFSSGTYIDAQGKTKYLNAHAFKMEPQGKSWTSTTTHSQYPIAWHISLSDPAINLQIDTPLPSQELASRNMAVPSYWEGTITAMGTYNGSPIRGIGYLEMTGYAQPIKIAP